MNKKRKAVILLSGGLDSTTCLAIAKNQGFETFAISFRYGQRHEIELDAAERIAQTIGVAKHIFVDIDLRQFGGSALTDNINVPKNNNVNKIGNGIPITYVPARNTIFLSFALGWAETLGACGLFIGVNALDYSGYPDCRPEYIAAFEKMANLATKAATQDQQTFKIHTPLISLTKAEIIRQGLELGVDYSLTTSCYDPQSNAKACGQCDACLLRQKGFDENKMEDPAAII